MRKLGCEQDTEFPTHLSYTIFDSLATFLLWSITPNETTSFKACASSSTSV